jgi:hypothetical protein
MDGDFRDKIIRELRDELHDKDCEIEDLVNVIDSLKGYFGNISDYAESGDDEARAALRKQEAK